MISVIILTFNEGLHIERCLESASRISDDIVVIDSYSSDETEKICRKKNVRFYQRNFINQSETLNWALENINYRYEKVFRLDADEYVSETSVHLIESEDFKQKLKEYDAVSVSRDIIFMDTLLRFGGLKQRTVTRILDVNTCRYDLAEMDERVITAGVTGNSGLSIVDHNLNNIEYFILKHVAYARREAQKRYEIYDLKNYSKSDRRMIKLKKLYSRNNSISLAIIYFVYRYLILLGFLDGKAGFYYHFYQALFYRLTVLQMKKENN